MFVLLFQTEVDVACKMKLNRTFTESLTNKSSEEYVQLRDQLVRNVS